MENNKLSLVGKVITAAALVASLQLLKFQILSNSVEELENNLEPLPKMSHLANSINSQDDNNKYALSLERTEDCQKFAYVGAISSLEYMTKRQPEAPEEVYYQPTTNQLAGHFDRVEDKLTDTFNQCKVGHDQTIAFTEDISQSGIDYLENKYQDARSAYTVQFLAN